MMSTGTPSAPRKWIQFCRDSLINQLNYSVFTEIVPLSLSLCLSVSVLSIYRCFYLFLSLSVCLSLSFSLWRFLFIFFSHIYCCYTIYKTHNIYTTVFQKHYYQSIFKGFFLYLCRKLHLKICFHVNCSVCWQRDNHNFLTVVTFWVRLKYDKYSMFSSANLQILPA